MRVSLSLFIFLWTITSIAAPQVRVRLLEKYDRLILRGDITIDIENPLKGSRVTIENQGQNYTWTLETVDGKVTGLEDFSTPLNITGKNLSYENLKLPEHLRVLVVRQPSGKFSRFMALGLVELERYLAGVLPGEMPLGWPLEALKAQLITARTYTLKQIENRRRENFDVDSTVRDQLFSYEHVMDEGRRKTLTTALESTRGMVLNNTKGEVVLANYHADCGGQTELAKNVWNYGLKGVAVSDFACARRPSSQWTYAVSAQDLVKKLKPEVSVIPTGKLASIAPISSTDSGRINLLALNFSDGRRVEILATRLRELLGYSLVKSTRFTAKINAHEVLFSGRGFGHGVGLCQWGAKDLAKSGKNYREILNHYFPGLKIAEMSFTDGDAPALGVSSAIEIPAASKP